MKSKYAKQLGGVSLFIVVFACLTVTIVTVSFVSLMIRGQQQATNTDLANSAYDSATAGVEDAKRLALLYNQCRASGMPASCSTIRDAVELKQCNSIHAGLGLGSDAEVPVTSNGGGAELNQAYTCVKINYATDDVRREIRGDTTQILELKGVGQFNRVRLSWHVADSAEGATPVMGAPSATTPNLPPKANWPATAPALLRAQVVQTRSGGFTLAQFNDTTEAGNNSNSVFLYPVSVSGTRPTDSPDLLLSAADPALASNPTTSKQPQSVFCYTGSYGAGDYACSVDLVLSNPRGGGSRANAYLVLSSFYNAADYQVQLINTSSVVQFDGIQPMVDSTGRANDLFRRVNSRIEFSSDNFEYPNAALDLDDTLCKAFTVTDDRNDFTTGGCNL